jgi:hypothetical protein
MHNYAWWKMLTWLQWELPKQVERLDKIYAKMQYLIVASMWSKYMIRHEWMNLDG